MALVRLGQFCRAYALQYGSDRNRVYGSLYAAILGDKVKGEVRGGYWYVDARGATNWLRGKRAAVPTTPPYTPNFHMEPDSPFRALFMDEED